MTILRKCIQMLQSKAALPHRCLFSSPFSRGSRRLDRTLISGQLKPGVRNTATEKSMVQIPPWRRIGRNPTLRAIKFPPRSSKKKQQTKYPQKPTRRKSTTPKSSGSYTKTKTENGPPLSKTQSLIPSRTVNYNSITTKGKSNR